MDNRAIVISDIHLHNFTAHDTNGSRLANCIDVINTVSKYAAEHSITTVLDAGDLFDSVKAVPTVVMLAAIEAFGSLFMLNPELKWYGITGNHDLATKSVWEQPIVSSRDIMEYIFIDKFFSLDNKNIYINGAFVHGIPYYQSKEDYLTALESIEPYNHEGKPEILLIHQTPKLQEGYITADTEPTNPLYNSFDMVFCGHIHCRRKLTSNFMLVGNPIATRAGEGKGTKGFLVIDLANPKDIEVVETNYPRFITLKEGGNIEGHEQDYITYKPKTEFKFNSAGKKFEADNSKADIVREYYKQEGKEDELTLDIGLKLVENLK